MDILEIGGDPWHGLLAGKAAVQATLPRELIAGASKSSPTVSRT